MAITEVGTEVTLGDEPGEETYDIKDPKAVLEALSRAKADAKKYRELSETQAAGNKTLTERIAELEGVDGVAKWKQRAIKVSAGAALAEAGVKDPARVLDFMNVDAVNIDDNGNLTGFDESLAETKKKLPELFDVKRRVGGKADIHETGDPKEKKSVTDMQVDKLFSR